jgi:cell division protein FtsA
MPKSNTIIRNGQGEYRLAVLDVGTTKISCFIANVDEKNRIRVTGVGHKASKGVKNGAVVDLKATETQIRAAVDQAALMDGQQIDEVFVSFANHSMTSSIAELEVEIDGQSVVDADISRVLRRARQEIDPEDKLTIHTFPACYSIDGVMGVKEPVGMYGEKLSVAIHTILASPGPVRNLESAVAQGHLRPKRLVSSAYASGLGSLVDDELELGAACIDLGGGTTNISVFAQNALVYAATIPLGGDDLTRDLARELLTPIEEAERIKVLYASVLPSENDVRDIINIPSLGESTETSDGQQQVSRAQISAVVQPRLEELFALIRQKLVDSGFDFVRGKRVVLTGGASQIQGLTELAQKALGKKVRLAKPHGIEGLPDAAKGPGFATTAGLLHYAVKAPIELGEDRSASKNYGHDEGGVMQRMGTWLKENF